MAPSETMAALPRLSGARSGQVDAARARRAGHGAAAALPPSPASPLHTLPAGLDVTGVQVGHQLEKQHRRAKQEEEHVQQQQQSSMHPALRLLQLQLRVHALQIR